MLQKIGCVDIAFRLGLCVISTGSLWFKSQLKACPQHDVLCEVCNTSSCFMFWHHCQASVRLAGGAFPPCDSPCRQRNQLKRFAEHRFICFVTFWVCVLSSGRVACCWMPWFIMPYHEFCGNSGLWASAGQCVYSRLHGQAEVRAGCSRWQGQGGQARPAR